VLGFRKRLRGRKLQRENVIRDSSLRPKTSSLKLDFWRFGDLWRFGDHLAIELEQLGIGAVAQQASEDDGREGLPVGVVDGY